MFFSLLTIDLFIDLVVPLAKVGLYDLISARVTLKLVLPRCTRVRVKRCSKHLVSGRSQTKQVSDAAFMTLNVKEFWTNGI